jgi:cysteine desulfuration protein SufE
MDIERILEDAGFLDDPRDRMDHLMELGAALPPFDPAARTQEHLVPGCVSQVWVTVDLVAGALVVRADADSRLVRGLAAIVVAIYDGKTPAAALAMDPEDIFERMDLARQVTPQRRNGLYGMVRRIRRSAEDLGD